MPSADFYSFILRRDVPFSVLFFIKSDNIHRIATNIHRVPIIYHLCVFVKAKSPLPEIFTIY